MGSPIHYVFNIEMNLEQIWCENGNGNRTYRRLFSISGTVNFFIFK